jgi:SAM-dependent methyltransferase
MAVPPDAQDDRPPGPHPAGEGAASEFYDQMWRDWARLDAASPAGFHRRRLVAKWALDAAPRAQRILDVGCGEGGLLRELSRRFPDALLWGADLSEQALEDTRRSAPRTETFLLDLADPDFDVAHAERLQTHDLVTCCEVLEHLDDDVLALTRLGRLLRPGGTLITTVPGGRPTRFDTAIGHRRHYRPGELDAALRRAGLQPERIAAWGFPFHSAYRVAVRAASWLTLPSGSKPDARPAPGIGSTALGWAYRAIGRGLIPLFYLNLPRWGRQLLAVARRPAPRVHD